MPQAHTPTAMVCRLNKQHRITNIRKRAYY
nr:MAG TPA: zinc finger domain-containing protein [Caudoviricetes sp.]